MGIALRDTCRNHAKEMGMLDGTVGITYIVGEPFAATYSSYYLYFSQEFRY